MTRVICRNCGAHYDRKLFAKSSSGEALKGYWKCPYCKCPKYRFL